MARTIRELFPIETVKAQRIDKGPRESVDESHHKHVADVLGTLRKMGHKVGKVERTLLKGKAAESSRARTVIMHQSGKHKLKTRVLTAFNMDGGDHLFKAITGPDDTTDAVVKKKAAA